MCEIVICSHETALTRAYHHTYSGINLKCIIDITKLHYRSKESVIYKMSEKGNIDPNKKAKVGFGVKEDILNNINCEMEC